MARKKKTQTAEEIAHERQCRFNSGFWDARFAVERGWDNQEHNFGFYAHGPLAGIRTPTDVLSRHFNKVYAVGWLAGLSSARRNELTDTSEPAYLSAVASGAVTE